MGFDELLLLGDFIPLDFDYEKKYYLWDDWDKCGDLVSKNKDLFVYTVISEDGKLWIVEGNSLFNRMGYLFSNKYIAINEPIEY